DDDALTVPVEGDRDHPRKAVRAVIGEPGQRRRLEELPGARLSQLSGDILPVHHSSSPPCVVRPRGRISPWDGAARPGSTSWADIRRRSYLRGSLLPPWRVFRPTMITGPPRSIPRYQPGAGAHNPRKMGVRAHNPRT